MCSAAHLQERKATTWCLQQLSSYRIVGSCCYQMTFLPGLLLTYSTLGSGKALVKGLEKHENKQVFILNR